MDHFSVVQSGLGPPAPELVLKAFQQTPGLTIEDGRFAVRHQLGIFIEGTQEATAAALVQSLANNGILSAFVEASNLPDLPAGMYVRNMRIEDEALTMSDAKDGHPSVPWAQIRLIGAGDIPEAIYRHDSKLEHLVHEYTVTDDSKGAHQVMHATLLLMIGDEPRPRLIELERFNFACLGPGETLDHRRNMVLVLDQLLARAPKALRNRGAMRCAGDSRALLPYDSRHSFDREVVWLLWLARQPLA